MPERNEQKIELKQNTHNTSNISSGNTNKIYIQKIYKVSTKTCSNMGNFFIIRDRETVKCTG